jgi:flotillin
VAAAAQGIAASNLTILNGTEGVNQVVAGLVGQGLSILDTLRRSTAAAGASNGPVPVRAAEAAAAQTNAARDSAVAAEVGPASAAEIGAAPAGGQ